eukprot:gnl/TRDRNA2_/TRDRNA2_195351_c0_seq1.p1 gnl/TRDRNA2_/TRDRNA2_195351_c0~~gnl/TRDRNA2_/TRDRNA2_195351_c0_seq1.p1  ORF type:complete len:303 (+),score=81.83 gnl/TRDRNA2_/TRDRNA2_195351_c0_seq1:55-963(+)
MQQGHYWRSAALQEAQASNKLEPPSIGDIGTPVPDKALTQINVARRKGDITTYEEITDIVLKANAEGKQGKGERNLPIMRTEGYREFLEKVQQDGMALETAPEEYLCSREIVAEACWQNGKALQFAPPEFQADFEVVMCAVTKCPDVLMYASEELRDDKRVVTQALMNNGGALAYVSENLQNDPEVVLMAVQDRGMALRYASKELRGDRDIVRAAVWQSKQALRFASEELRNNADFVKQAATENPYASVPTTTRRAPGRTIQQVVQDEEEKANDAAHVAMQKPLMTPAAYGPIPPKPGYFYE